MKKVLSTKKLKPNQRELLLGGNCSVVDYNAISISFLEFDAPSTIENAIFTSQNGVASMLNKNIDIKNCFCVGERTASRLRENNHNVVKIAKNGGELANFLVKKCSNDLFYYFCSEQRREALPEIINHSKNELIELKTYKNVPNHIKFEQKWDGILFFSPSGVKSFCQKNTIENATAICIGETTAIEARKYSPKVIVANETTIESVIAKAVNSL